MNHSKWKEENLKLLETHLCSGSSFISFASVADVSIKTLYEWLDKYPEFKRVKEKARKQRPRLYSKAQ